jgi:hypothetical protein
MRPRADREGAIMRATEASMSRRALVVFTFAVAGTIGLALGSSVLIAQRGRPASPAGTAATEVRGRYVGSADDPVYQGGKWIEITYSRPIKRGRDLWGAGATYGRMLNGGAPVWRAGANVSTRLKTEVPLVINGKTIAPGEYSLFIDLKPNAWTFIVSTWNASTVFPSRDKDALYGAFDYTPDRDVVRAPMTLETQPHSIDQLTWLFLDMSDAGGRLAMTWDKVLASVPFKIG